MLSVFSKLHWNNYHDIYKTIFANSTPESAKITNIKAQIFTFDGSN